MRCKMDMLKSHCHHLEQYLLSVEEKCRFEVERLKEKEDDVIHCWEAELETGGNVRFIDGNPKHSWFNSCVELVTSRFLASDFEVLSFLFTHFSVYPNFVVNSLHRQKCTCVHVPVHTCV